jgi:hypothetical protein
MVWNHFAVKLATRRRSNFLCSRLAVPPRIVPHGVLGNNPHGRGLCGQAVGIKEVHDDIWLVSFMDYRFWGTSIWIPGCSNRLKTRSAQKCYLCSRYVV